MMGGDAGGNVRDAKCEAFGFGVGCDHDARGKRVRVRYERFLRGGAAK